MSSATTIVTGGTKGLGRELSLAFGRAGHAVVAVYHGDEQAAAEWTALFEREKLKGKAVRHDVGSSTGGDTVWELPEIREAGRLTLIHNACAAFAPKPMHLLQWEDFETSLTVALKGGWLCSQAVVRQMVKARSGTIVNVLTAALHGAPPKGFAAYLTAKHALRGYTQSLAAEYAARGVRVFSVSPGFMKTSLTEKWDPRLREAIQAASTQTSNPLAAAKRVLELVESAEVPGQGEDYPV